MSEPLREELPHEAGEEAEQKADLEPGDPLPRQLHPLPRGLVELYGLLAVLVVLVPEWMAGGALFGFRDNREGSDLPMASGAWQRLPELRLATMTMAELRPLARAMGLRGYGRCSREQLTAALLPLLRRLQSSGGSGFGRPKPL